MTGHEYEKLCGLYLSCIGYTNVHVTQGSGDQGVDVVATRNGEQIAFQCKLWNKPVSNKAVQEVYGGMRLYGCTRAAVITNSTFTPGAIEVARADDVILLPERTPEMMRDVIIDAGAGGKIQSIDNIPSSYSSQNRIKTTVKSTHHISDSYNHKSISSKKNTSFPCEYGGIVHLTAKVIVENGIICRTDKGVKYSEKKLLRKRSKNGWLSIIDFIRFYVVLIISELFDNNSIGFAICSLGVTVIDLIFWARLGLWIYYKTLSGRLDKARSYGWIP